MKFFKVLIVLTVLFGFCSPSFAKDSATTDVITANVQMGNINLGSFTLLELPGIKTDVIEFQDGEDPIIHKRPGRTRYGNAVLQRPISDDTTIFDWYTNIKNLTYDQRNLILTLYNKKGSAIGVYRLIDAWPANWEYAENETITFAVGEIERIIQPSN